MYTAMTYRWLMVCRWQNWLDKLLMKIEKKQTVQEFQISQSVPAPVIVEQRPEQVEFDDKITLLRVADEEARALDKAIKQVSLGYSDVVQHVTIANSLGVCVEDERVRLRLACNSIAQQDGQIQTGFASIGGTCGFELFFRKIRLLHWEKSRHSGL